MFWMFGKDLIFFIFFKLAFQYFPSLMFKGIKNRCGWFAGTSKGGTGSLSIILYLIRLCLWFTCPVAEVMAQIHRGTCACTSLPRARNESDEWPFSDPLRRKHSGDNTRELEVSLKFNALCLVPHLLPQWTQKSIKACECPWTSRKDGQEGLTPGWGTGMVPMGTEEAVKGQGRWIIWGLWSSFSLRGKLCLH